MPAHDQGTPTGRDGARVASSAVARGLGRLLERLVSRKDIRHAIVAVESGDRSLRWIGAMGDAHPDGTPMRDDTPFWVASVTKLYIAACILKLEERGLLGLGDPVSKHLPQSLIGGIHRLGGVDYTDQITLQHLLGHSSGLPDYFERPRGGRSLLERLAERDLSWTTEDAMRIVREEMTPLFPPQPVDAARRRISYSDTNYQLLISVIEAVTGRPLQAAFEELLFRPLGLEGTYLPGTRTEPAPKPATVWAGDRPLDIPLGMQSARDLVSTADETLAFMWALVRGELFDRTSTLDLMLGRWSRFSLSLVLTRPGWPIEYGLGMMRVRIPRLFSPMRPTPPVVGHTGISGSWLFHCPRLDVVLSGTVDQMAASALPFRFVPKLLRMLDAVGR